MAILKCKICGGDMEISPDKTFGTCEYCGSTMTLPKIDDEQRAAAFNRGNHFRRSGEFDKALAVYEKIVEEDPNDAEAHWCCALCRFGIEWVEDPATTEYLPTCHRASFDPFTDDVDCKAALELSDGLTKKQYQRDASKIVEVQKGILATSQNEKPFDVFICYKETDENGNRTVDSTLAQDIYYQLTSEGMRVFFARITLEDKVGSEYEPYIFAALNSAKAMVVVGTRPENFNAVWVKNEWSRYLSIVKHDRRKVLLPCYRDMDPYDLPEQLSILQSYDMAKIGFIQDLIHGIKKIAKADAPKAEVKETVVVGAAGANVAPLLKRAFMFLEDGNWQSADEYAEKVLDIDPENAEAYFAKAMADLEKKTRKEMKDAPGIGGNANIQKALRFGGNALKDEINGYIESTRAAEKKRRDKEAARIAAEKKRKEEAEAKRRAEEAQKEAQQKAKAEKVIAAFKAKRAGETGKSLEQKLDDAQKIVASLEIVVRNYDDNTLRLNETKRILEEIETQQEDLQSQRGSLGVFAGKEKKRIDTEIAALETKKETNAAMLKELTDNLGSYPTKSVAVQALEAAKNEVIGLEKQIENADADNEYTFEEALSIFLKESAVAATVAKNYPAAKLFLAMKGAMQGKTNTIVFGRYFQNKNGSAEPIEWLVLARENSRMLVISKYALDCQQYNASKTAVTWETCSLRKWLNGTFINNAFNLVEQSVIQSTTVTADKNPLGCGPLPGNNTIDKVFLLSITEVEKYFSSDSARQCSATTYAKAQGANNYNGDGRAACCWWLRSPGNRSGSAAGVNFFGSVFCSGDRVNNDKNGIRPALWIYLRF